MLSRRVLLAWCAALPAAAAADTPPDPAQATDFIRRAGADLSQLYRSVPNPAEREAQLARFLDRVVDEDGVARFCLGRYWQAATPAQQAEYLRLFRRFLLQGTINRLGDYQAGSSGVTPLTPTARPDGIYVPTVVEKPGSKPVTIGWLVTTVDGTMRIADVTAEGVSLRITQRSDFASFLSRNGGNVEALLAAMRSKVGA